MPWTMGAFAIGALGMIGLPPTAGFLGKWYMLSGAMQTANWFAVAVIIVEHAAERGLFPADRLPRVLPRPPSAAGHGHGHDRRGALADRGRAGRDGGRHSAAVLLPRCPAGARQADDWRVMRWTTTGLYARRPSGCSGSCSSSCWRPLCSLTRRRAPSLFRPRRHIRLRRVVRLRQLRRLISSPRRSRAPEAAGHLLRRLASPSCRACC